MRCCFRHLIFLVIAFSHIFQLALACYMERIDLSAHGFYATPNIGFDWNTCTGNPFSYYTYGASFSEVEIDTLTGDFHTRKAEIVMDLGHSLNPAIDIGQVKLYHQAHKEALGYSII